MNVLTLIRDIKGTRQKPAVLKSVTELRPPAQPKSVRAAAVFRPPPALDLVDEALRKRAALG